MFYVYVISSETDSGLYIGLLVGLAAKNRAT